MELFKRRYSLTIGDYKSGEGILITELQVRFRIRKSSDNKKREDACTIDIYNLSDSSLAHFETPYAVAVLSVGYGTDLARIFYGQIVDVETQKRGADRITSVKVKPSYTELRHKLISAQVPPNATVYDAIEVIRTKLDNISLGVYRGNNVTKKITYGYPLSGVGKQLLNEIGETYGIEWRIENESIYVNDAETVSNPNKDEAVVLSKETGLIGEPYYFEATRGKSKTSSGRIRGVKFQALINPEVTPGSLVKVVTEDKKAFWKVSEISYNGDYRGTTWTMELTCTESVEVSE